MWHNSFACIMDILFRANNFYTTRMFGLTPPPVFLCSSSKHNNMRAYGASPVPAPVQAPVQAPVKAPVVPHCGHGTCIDAKWSCNNKQKIDGKAKGSVCVENTAPESKKACTDVKPKNVIKCDKKYDAKVVYLEKGGQDQTPLCYAYCEKPGLPWLLIAIAGGAVIVLFIILFLLMHKGGGGGDG